MEQESTTNAKLDCQFGVWLSVAWFRFRFLSFFFSSYHNGCCYQFLSLHRCYYIAFSWRVLEIKSKMLAKWQFANNNSSTKKCRKWSLFFMVLFSFFGCLLTCTCIVVDKKLEFCVLDYNVKTPPSFYSSHMANQQQQWQQQPN